MQSHSNFKKNKAEELALVCKERLRASILAFDKIEEALTMEQMHSRMQAFLSNPITKTIAQRFLRGASFDGIAKQYIEQSIVPQKVVRGILGRGILLYKLTPLGIEAHHNYNSNNNTESLSSTETIFTGASIPSELNNELFNPNGNTDDSNDQRQNLIASNQFSLLSNTSPFIFENTDDFIEFMNEPVPDFPIVGIGIPASTNQSNTYLEDNTVIPDLIPSNDNINNNLAADSSNTTNENPTITSEIEETNNNVVFNETYNVYYAVKYKLDMVLALPEISRLFPNVNYKVNIIFYNNDLYARRVCDSLKFFFLKTLADIEPATKSKVGKIQYYTGSKGYCSKVKFSEDLVAVVYIDNLFFVKQTKYEHLRAYVHAIDFSDEAIKSLKDKIINDKFSKSNKYRTIIEKKTLYKALLAITENYNTLLSKSANRSFNQIDGNDNSAPQGNVVANNTSTANIFAMLETNQPNKRKQPSEPDQRTGKKKKGSSKSNSMSRNINTNSAPSSALPQENQTFTNSSRPMTNLVNDQSIFPPVLPQDGYQAIEQQLTWDTANNNLSYSHPSEVELSNLHYFDTSEISDFLSIFNGDTNVESMLDNNLQEPRHAP